MVRESELEATVETMLQKANVKYLKEPVIGNTRPDFLITTENGDQIVVEVKGWQEGPESVARAINQVNKYKELSKAAAALLVTATEMTLRLPTGIIVSLDSFLPALTELSKSLATKRHPVPLVKPRVAPNKKVFASMPFASQYDDTFIVAIQPAALALHAVAERVDHDGRSGEIVIQIKEMIRQAKVVVADISESRPNVCHEIGFAEAMEKPVVQISSTPLDSLPFNLRNNRTIPYTIGQASRLRTKLVKELSKWL